MKNIKNNVNPKIRLSTVIQVQMPHIETKVTYEIVETIHITIHATPATDASNKDIWGEIVEMHHVNFAQDMGQMGYTLQIAALNPGETTNRLRRNEATAAY